MNYKSVVNLVFKCQSWKPRSTAFCHRRASFGRQCYHCNRPRKISVVGSWEGFLGRSLGISVFWLILLAEIFCFSKLWRDPGSNSLAMFAHDRKLPGVHTDQVKLLQDMGFPADPSFNIQWVDDLFSIISQHQAAGLDNVCAIHWSYIFYIENTLILGGCHTACFIMPLGVTIQHVYVSGTVHILGHKQPTSNMPRW